MQLTHDSDCHWRLGRDCTCEKSDPRDATIARLTAELEAARADAEKARRFRDIARREAGEHAARAEAAAALLPRAYEAGRDDAVEDLKSADLSFGYGQAVNAIRAVPAPSPADLLSRTKEGGK